MAEKLDINTDVTNSEAVVYDIGEYTLKRDLYFSFPVGEKHHRRGYNGLDFSKEDIDTKLLHGIGQASTFDQSDEHYRLYLKNIANKGLEPSQQLSPDEVDDRLHGLVKDGFAENGGPRYRLTPKSLELIVKQTKRATKESDPAATLEPQPNVVEELPWGPESDLIIRPTDIRGLSPEESHKKRRDIRRLGERNLDVLAELELAGGCLESDGSLASEIRHRSGDVADTTSYNKVIQRFQEGGLVLLSEDGRALSLTEAGYDTIALVKAYSYNLRGRAEGVNMNSSTSIDIIEYILDETGYELFLDINPEDLPEHSNWLFSPNSGCAAIEHIAQELGRTYESITRRISAMHGERGLLEVAYSKQEGGKGVTVDNVRVTKSGLEYLLKFRLEARKRDQVLDEAEVEEVEELVDGCRRLAEATGNDVVLSMLDEGYDTFSLFTLTQPEFEATKAGLEADFKTLKQNYVEQFGLPKAA